MKRLTLFLLCLSLLVSSTSLSSVAAGFSGGLLNEDLTIAQGPWVLKRTVEIPRGKTLRIEKGVTVDASGLKTAFWVQGKIEFIGSREQPIQFIGNPEQYIIFNDAEHAVITAKHLHVDGGGRGGFLPQTGYYGQAEISITDSEFIDLPDFWATDSKWPITFERNIFKGSQGFSVAPTNSVTAFRYNWFIGEPMSYFGQVGWLDVWGRGESGEVEIKGNDFSSVKTTAVISKVDIDLSENFWGTNSLVDIQNRVLDSLDGLKYPGSTVLLPALAAISPDTPRLSNVLENRKSKVRLATKVYKNCAALNSVFPGGIAKSRNAKNLGAPSTRLPYISSKGYALNRKLDKDRDSIVCER